MALAYTLGEGANAFLPRHTFFGYRYLAVTATGPVTFASLRSVPVSSVAKEMERGSVTTGNARVNRLIENVRWGVLSNYLSIPTDCPQERMKGFFNSNMVRAAFSAPCSFIFAEFASQIRSKIWYNVADN